MLSLNQEQKAVVESPAPLKVVLAAPGSGKTRTVVATMEADTKRKEYAVKPSQMMAVTYTVAAARELEQRVESVFGQGVRLGYCGTLHGYLFHFLKTHTGLNTIIPEDESADLLKRIAANMGVKVSDKKLAQMAADPMLMSGRPCPRKDEIAVVEFHRRLVKAGMVTFDTMLHHGLSCMRMKQAQSTLETDFPFKAVYWDEGQDGSPADFEIFELMPAVLKMIVGDTNQSIFGFRGSAPERLVALANKAGWEQFNLSLNYRSATAICDVANELMHSETDFAIQAQSTDHGSVHLLEKENPLSEMIGAANFIEDGDVNDSAILCRRRDMAKAMADYLRAVGLPVRERVEPPQPPDWRLARLLVASYAAPWNNAAAHLYISAKESTEIAARLYREAEQKATTLGEKYFGAGWGTGGLWKALDDVGISGESIGQLKAVAGPEPIDPQELLIAASRDADLGREEGTGIYVGTMHCSPGDEQILTVNGYKPISELDPQTDRLFCLDGKCNTLTRGVNGAAKTGKGYAFTRSSHHHEGELITLTTDESKTRVTPDHKVRVRFDESFYGSFVVYLMRRGRWWRVGVCGSPGIAPYKSGGLSGRLATEQADAGWILGVYKTKNEALREETFIQAKYGITGVSFQRTHLLKELTIPELHKLHERIADVSGNRVNDVFRDFGLVSTAPLYKRVLGKRRDNTSALHGYWFETAAANVLSGYMRIPVATFEEFRWRNGSARPRHLPVSVSRGLFSGTVYGIDVPPHRFYVSGGAIVHNSAKGREFGSVAIIGMEEGLCPSLREGTSIDEERRLFYVAITRAKHRLLVSWCNSRPQSRGPNLPPGPPEPRTMSRFVKEAGLAV